VETQTQSAPVTLRGTGRGLEIVIEEGPPLFDVITELEARLAHSPGFFAGAEATIWLGGRTLPPGGLAHIKAVTDRYEVKIAALRAERAEIQQAASNLQIPVSTPTPTRTPLATELPVDAARMIVGTVRSGALIDAAGHLAVVGDVNAGAELRASGNIAVLGALRGLAHAACGGEEGFIVALRLEAQQIRIGSLIARAGEPDGTPRGPEIAYAASGRIIVEPYLGKPPGNGKR
jgi:septum site-determining protein MinC